MQAGGDQAGEVGHIDHQVGADLVGDAPERGEVELTRVGRPAGQDGLRAVFPGQPLDLGHVDQVVLFAHVVGGDVVELAGEVQPHPVGEVTAVSEGLTENRVPGCSSADIAAALACAPECGCTLAKVAPNSALSRSIASCSMTSTCLAAAVVAAPGIALGVLVGQHRTLSLHHRRAARSSRWRSSPGCSAAGSTRRRSRGTPADRGRPTRGKRDWPGRARRPRR